MLYLNLETGDYPVTGSDIRRLFPNVSFPAEPEEFNLSVRDFGFTVVSETPQPDADYSQVVVEVPPVLSGSNYQQTWEVQDAPAEVITLRTEKKSEEMRQIRNQLLAASDWTQIPDAISAGANQAQWSEYRQQLREITSQPGFPWDVTWPEKPAVVPPSGRIDYRQFYDSLIASPIYMVIRQKAISDVVMLTACVEFIAAISDAKSGRPNVAAIQTCINLLCAAAQFTPQERDMLAEAMEVGGMDRIYTLP